MQGITQSETDLLTTIKEIIDNSQDNFNRLYLDGDPVAELGKKYYEELGISTFNGFKQKGKRMFPIFSQINNNIDDNCCSSSVGDSESSKFEQLVFDFCN